jgi:hypothetical protein
VFPLGTWAGFLDSGAFLLEEWAVILKNSLFLSSNTPKSGILVRFF